MPLMNELGIDAVILDKEDEIWSAIEVKSQPVSDQWLKGLPQQFGHLGKKIAFVMVIDPLQIALYPFDGSNLADPLVRFDTKEILKHYDSDFLNQPVYEAYLLTLTEAWLRDLAYHWKSDRPPGTDELQVTGFLKTLEGGTTKPLGA